MKVWSCVAVFESRAMLRGEERRYEHAVRWRIVTADDVPAADAKKMFLDALVSRDGLVEATVTLMATTDLAIINLG